MLFRAALVWGIASAAGFGAWADSLPWWDDYPRIVETLDVGIALDHHASVGVCATDNDPGWGTYGQMSGRRPHVRNAFHGAGIRTMSYFETFGQSYCYIAEIGEQGGAEFAPILHQHWGWQGYSGGPIHWVGVQNWFDDEEFARPYTRTHPVYGGPPMRYPDGTEATGYDGPETDPRNSRVFDAACSKSIYGDISTEYSFNAAVNAIDPDTGQPVGPLDGLFEVDGAYTGLFMFGRDTACPHWLDYVYASTHLAAGNGLDGMWTDNYSPWDSFGYGPNQRGFGDWSVATFRDYLAAHFTAAELTAMGVADPAAFDIAAYLIAQAETWSGVSQPHLNHGVWRDARWMDDPLWRAYLIHKRQTGTAALDGYYDTVKQAAEDAGNSEFFIAGNDIPFYNLGWCRGELDMVSTELSPGWHMGAGSRGIMLPPLGRFAPVYRLGREHAKSRIMNIWLYLEGPFASYRLNPNLLSVFYFEMLANHALPMFHPGNPRVAGTDADNAAFFAFVESVQDEWGARIPTHDVGVYYSSSSLLRELAPGGFLNMNDQAHQFGIWGIGTMLGEMHQQYRYIPEWSLTPEALEGLRVLIIPHALVFDPDDAANIIQPWLNQGGKLIVTGDSGMYLPESGNFAVNPDGPCTADLTGDILRIAANAGRDYYVATDGRPALLDAWRGQYDAFTADTARLVDAPSAPSTIGVSTFADAALRRYYLDLHNYDIDVDTDTLTAAPPASFEVELPAFVQNPTATAFSPDAAPVVLFAHNGDGKAQMDVGAFLRYACVVIDSDTDGDGLTDAAEIRGDHGYVTDPDSADTDGDGISDYDEIMRTLGFATNPLLADTDDDGINDLNEIEGGSDPLDPLSPNPGPLPIIAYPAALALLGIGALILRRRNAR